MTASALDIIRAEHRSLASVLHALQYLARQIRDAGATPDYGLLRLIVDYIEEFHQRYHHPKEDEYLFRAIQARTREADLPVRKNDEVGERHGRVMANESVAIQGSFPEEDWVCSSRSPVGPR